MKKVLLALSIVLFLVGCDSKTNNNRQISEVGAHLTCHLNIEDCTQEFNGKTTEISFTPKPIRAMMPTTLRITNLGDYENLSVIVSGVNMDMGKIHANFVKKGDVHEANIMFSACVGDMLYEGVLYNDKEPIGYKFEIVIGIF
ncbi:MAG: hypothetical protein GXZ15_03795 [Campylobacter sp.]|nr:hypothetical protein [Campylobacter sp.]